MQTTESSVDSVMHALMSFGRVMKHRIPGDTLEVGTFWLLKTLATQGSMRVTELAAITNLDTSTVSRHVTQLQRDGFIARTPDPDDRRAQRVELSGEGREHLQASYRRRRALLINSLDGWDLADIDQFEHLLTRFVSGIETPIPDLENA